MTFRQALIKAEQGYAIRKTDWNKGMYIFLDITDGYLKYGHNETIYCQALNFLDEWELF